MKMSKTLAEFPSEMVRLGCEKCPRVGQYRRENLIAKYGDDMDLPSLRHLLANCPRHNKLGDSCGVIYLDLVPKP